MPRTQSKTSPKSSADCKVAQDICKLLAQIKIEHPNPEWSAALGFARSRISEQFDLGTEYGRVVIPEPKKRRTPKKAVKKKAASKKAAPKPKPKKRSPICKDLMQ